MKFQNTKYWLSIFSLFAILVACEPKEYVIEEFDINLPKSEITSFSPTTGLIGSNVTLTGTNLDDKSLKVYIGAVECKVIEKTPTSATITLPRVIETGFFTTINSLGARFVTSTKFAPQYPETVVKLAELKDTLFKSANYTLVGENLDLLTAVIFSDTIITIDGTTVKDPKKLTFSAKEKNPLKAKLKTKENLSFKCRAGNDLGQKKDIVVMDTYPAANLVAIDPNTAQGNSTVKFIFDSFKYAKLISQIKIGSKVATFTFSEPYVLVTIPADAVDGAIEVKNAYGVTLKYANGLMLTLNK